MVRATKSAELPVDQEARDVARFALESNVVVEAGAGTGKTTLLTDRILFLLLGGPGGKPVPIGSLVALTFTEKAAGEIKLRLSERLSELASYLAGEPLEDVARARAEHTARDLEERFSSDAELLLSRARAALEDLDKAQIGTIHSFAAHLLRLYPVQAGVDPGFAVDEGDAFDELFACEWARWLDAELGEKPPRRQAWLEVLALAPLESLEELSRELCRERLDLARAGRPDPAAADWLEGLGQELSVLPDRLGNPGGNSKIAQTIGGLSRHLGELAKAARQEDPPLASAVSTFEATSSWPKRWDPEQEPVYEEARAAAKRASAGSEALLRRTCRLLVPFARDFRRRYTRRGLVSFDGLLLKARDLVRDHPQAREELKRKYAALLIDEFQDTDPLQGELLVFLAEEPGRSAARWQDARPGPGRLFVVGDPKQSIYRFRGADIAAYQGFTRHVLAAPRAAACDLLANFRSPAGVLDPVNAVFDKLMRPVEGLQAEHKALAPGRPGGPAAGPLVEFWPIAEPEKGGDYDAAAVQTAEANAIARWIQGHCGPDKGRRYKDAAVLLRTSTPLPALLDAFKAAAIPYAVELERYFYGAQEILDFINVLKVLDDPDDRLSLASILRSPLGGLDDRALYGLARDGGLDYIKKTKSPALEPLFSCLRALRARVGRTSLAELVHAVLDETPLLELSAAAYHGQQTASNLLKFARLAREASERRGETLREFIERALRELREAGREGESPLADEHLDAVRLLTIHKSKGLEFPVVFLAGAGGGRSAAAGEISLCDWASQSVGLRVPGAAAGATMARLETEEELRQDHEQVRLLYVALTRAKERLIVLGKEKAERRSFAWRLGSAGVWPDGAHGIASTRVRADAPPAPPAGGQAKRSAASEKLLSGLWRERAKRREQALAQAWTRSPTEYLAEAPKLERFDEGPASGGGARVGRLCHRVLQDWDFAGGGDLKKAVAAAAGGLERLEPGGDWPAAREEAAAVLKKFLASATARELSRVEILGRELAFVRGEGGTVLRGAIDLLYRRNGRLVVADYKTGRVGPAEAAKLKERYAAQGRAYCAAVEKALGVSSVEFRLIFLRSPELG